MNSALIQIILLVPAVLWLCTGTQREALLELMGLNKLKYPSSQRDTSELLLVVAGLLFVVLMATAPEARLLLMAIDAVGVDMFVLLLAIQLRGAALALWAWAETRVRRATRFVRLGARLSFRGAAESPWPSYYTVLLLVAYLSNESWRAW